MAFALGVSAFVIPGGDVLPDYANAAPTELRSATLNFPGGTTTPLQSARAVAALTF